MPLNCSLNKCTRGLLGNAQVTPAEPLKCRAAVLYENGQPLVVEDIEVGVPTEGQVRIKLVAAGICASDAHFVWGSHDFLRLPNHTLPAVLGHEGAGIVESIGAGVKSVKVGDHVLVTFMPDCGKCPGCLNPISNWCFVDNIRSLAQEMRNKTLLKDGTVLCSESGLGIFAEYTVLKESQVIKPITCRAAVLFEEGAPMTIEDVIIPVPKDDQVRIKMVSAGICASDGHMAWGEQKMNDLPGHTVPAVLGHEGAGIVESMGPVVRHLKVGDHVLTTFVPQCKQCPACANPLTNLCIQDNFDTLAPLPTKSLAKTGQHLCNVAGLGIYSEYAVMRESQAVKITKEANLENACVISCAVATGFYSATKQAKVTPGSICAVWGIGAIGLNTLQGCKFNGASHILAIDINPNKKDVALRYGATQFINPKDLDKPIEEFLQETYSGIHYAFDCFGSQQVVDQALKSLAPFGTFAMVGIAKAGTNIVYPTFDLVMGRKIVGGFMGQMTPEEGYTELTNLYVSGKYDIDGLITNKFKLDQINEAFQTLKDGQCVRSIIIF